MKLIKPTVLKENAQYAAVRVNEAKRLYALIRMKDKYVVANAGTKKRIIEEFNHQSDVYKYQRTAAYKDARYHGESEREAIKEAKSEETR